MGTEPSKDQVQTLDWLQREGEAKGRVWGLQVQEKAKQGVSRKWPSSVLGGQYMELEDLTLS